MVITFYFFVVLLKIILYSINLSASKRTRPPAPRSPSRSTRSVPAPITPPSAIVGVECGMHDINCIRCENTVITIRVIQVVQPVLLMHQ